MDKSGKTTSKSKQPDELSFGMVDLEGDEEEAEHKPLTLERMPAQKTAPAPSPAVKDASPDLAADKKPAAPAIPSPAAGGKPAPERHVQARPPSRYEPITVAPPPLLSPKTVKIILWLAVAAALLAGAIFGLKKWQEHKAEQEIQEKQNFDSRSLDSLREKALRNDGLK